MNLNSEISQKIQDLQVLEQNMQSFLMQKQSMQVEMNESLNALEELKKSSDEVYRILSGIMIKSDKKSIISDLEEKKKVLEIRISTIEKQERIIEDKISKLRSDITKSIEKDSKNNPVK